MSLPLTDRPRTLADILEDISSNQVDDFLGSLWPPVSLSNFSKNKTLYGFQEKALENAVKALYLFYEKCKGDKEVMFERYLENQISLDNIKQNSYLNEYTEYFPTGKNSNKISSQYFCNRMSFWMATGSGKTLIIVKLIEILHGLMMAKDRLPQRDILFLSHRNDLIQQLKSLVREFNEFSKVKINLVYLKEFDTRKKENRSIFKDEITVFYYRSDLISDTRKENITDFRDYDNNGNWFILLDEAHRGSQNDISKRQAYYSILSRNGFLFNFSATFTETNDNATCAFNFNLERFVHAGYGKQIYVSDQDVKGFDKKEDDFKEIHKQKIVLKTLILHTYICEKIEKIKATSDLLYHRPLLMSLVNSVNRSSKDMEKDGKVKEPDLKLLFTELQKIANNEIRDGLFDKAREELMQELSSSKYFFADKVIPINSKSLSKISYKKVLQLVFNAKTHGKIEVKRIPNNKQELIFQLSTTNKPFALIRIGDIAEWINKILDKDMEKGTTHDNTSEFSQINSEDSSINILMGSRTFYEGWDSNRPNIVLFVNIGTTSEAKKFVMQSIGRGVRIEPIQNRKSRLVNLMNGGEVSDDVYSKVKLNIHAPETLFIFGTNADNINKIIGYMRENDYSGTRYEEIGDIFVPLINKSIDKDDLLIPTFKLSNNLMINSGNIVRYSISPEDLALTETLLSNLNDKLVIMKYSSHDEGIYPEVVAATRKTFKDEKSKDKHYDTSSEIETLGNPTITLGRIIKYFGAKEREHDKFVTLSNQISHHSKISFRGDKTLLGELKEKIKIMQDYPAKEEELEEAYEANIPKEEYDAKQNELKGAHKLNIKDVEIDIKYIGEHYYNPLLVSNEEKQDYLKHIIQVTSEVKFIQELERVGKEVLDEEFDWWIFSKLDETVDKVRVPYYNKDRSQFSNHHPDFIFWLKKGNNYSIFFVDPKGQVHTDYQHKADWHSNFFGTPGYEIEFTENDTKVKVYLRFFTHEGNRSSKEYKDYWIDNIKQIADIAKD